ncbi:MAG: lipid-A-disaccharide synthase N-terminal domain-containing protein [Sedimentisphaerales bacterium]|nr:lipid-A-disaccharide synthase N-terminal domain-containing protein [Sedimentisphaerales bacterium]
MWDKIQGYFANLEFGYWVILGFAAQVAFTARFIVQWLASEKRGKSYIPLSFWYLSLVGSWGLLIYAIIRRDPVFILGNLFNSVVYLRNLMLIYREHGSLRPSKVDALPRDGAKAKKTDSRDDLLEPPDRSEG